MKKRNLIIIISSSLAVAVTATSLGLYYGLRSQTRELSPYVEVYETTGTKSKLQARQVDLSWRDYEFSGNTEVNVNPEEEKGLLHGTGVAMTHSSAYLLQNLETSQKEYALASLFSKSQGHLNVVRIPIGTSDYTHTTSFYTLDDMPSGQNDYNLASFTTAEDEEYLIPTLLEIKALNPEVIFVAAPWSAPAWMKSNESLIGGNLIGHGGNTLTLEEKAYAAYLVKFVSEYKEQGININYLSLVNEPTIANVDYPSMQMGTAQYIRVALEVCEGLDDADLSAKIMAYDHNVGSESDRIMFDLFAEEINANATLKKYVSGFAFHAYGAEWSSVYPSLLADNQTDYPKMENYMTEITESDESVDFAANISWSSANVTVGPLSHGMSMSIYWNALLTSEGQPVLGNDAHCFGMLSLQDEIITKSAAYYSFTHISRFAYEVYGVKPRLIDSLSDNEAKIKCASYLRGDGAYVFVLANNDATTYEDVDLVMNGKVVTYRIQPESLVTLVAPTLENHIPYSEGIDFDRVEIHQKTVDNYELFVTLDKPYTDIYFKVGISDIYEESATQEFTLPSPGMYKILLETEAYDIYLWAISGQKTAFLPLSLPKMSPSLTLEDSVATINFGLDIETSWSSFCDPYGKAIYKNSVPILDENAEQVNVTSNDIIDPIYILEETYQDSNYDSEKPYYFLVMEGKNGLSKFISYPLVAGASLFSAPAISLANVSGAPLLRVTATITGSIAADDLLLCVKEDGGERFEVSNISSYRLEYEFYASQMSKSGEWYDLVILDKNTEIEYDLPATAMEKNNITIGDSRYGLKEWRGLAKLAYDDLNYYGASADIQLNSDVPYLVVEGSLENDITVQLLLTYWTGSNSETLLTANNESVVNNRILFSVDLRGLNQSGTYYDIVFYIEDERSDMTSDMAINFARTVSHEGRLYRFQKWEGLLKVAFE